MTALEAVAVYLPEQRIPIEGGSPRIYAPHKAIRGWPITLLIILPSLRHGWRAGLRNQTTGVPPRSPRLAAFTADDLDEAGNRLRRLALIWDVRLRSLSGQQLDEQAGNAWTLRQLAFHVAESAFYADSVGVLP